VAEANAALIMPTIGVTCGRGSVGAAAIRAFSVVFEGAIHQDNIQRTCFERAPVYHAEGPSHH